MVWKPAQTGLVPSHLQITHCSLIGLQSVSAGQPAPAHFWTPLDCLFLRLFYLMSALRWKDEWNEREKDYFFTALVNLPGDPSALTSIMSCSGKRVKTSFK